MVGPALPVSSLLIDILTGIYLTGTYGSALAAIYSYNASNTSGHTKKSTVNAMTLFSFSAGNIIGTEIFLAKDAPDYIPGKIAILVLLSGSLVIALTIRAINLRMNTRREEALVALQAQNGWTDADMQRERERHAFADLTDKK